MAQEKNQEKNETEVVKEKEISDVIRIGKKTHSEYMNACVRALKDYDSITLKGIGIHISSAVIVAARVEEETGLCRICQDMTEIYNESFNGRDNRTRKLTVISITLKKV